MIRANKHVQCFTNAIKASRSGKGSTCKLLEFRRQAQRAGPSRAEVAVEDSCIGRCAASAGSMDNKRGVANELRKTKTNSQGAFSKLRPLHSLPLHY